MRRKLLRDTAFIHISGACVAGSTCSRPVLLLVLLLIVIIVLVIILIILLLVIVVPVVVVIPGGRSHDGGLAVPEAKQHGSHGH